MIGPIHASERGNDHPQCVMAARKRPSQDLGDKELSTWQIGKDDVCLSF
jgi:hypothetical protein